MSVFIGHILLTPIKRQKRYEQVLYEILQYLKTHEQEVSIKFNSNYIMISPTLTGYDVIHIPFHVSHLKTSYFRINHSGDCSNEVKIFGSVGWEILNILKEHFPSKVYLFHENLEVCAPAYKPLSLKEQLRRQVSWLEARKESENNFKIDEIEDLWATLETAVTADDYSGKLKCLETLINPLFCSANVLLKCEKPELLQALIQKNNSKNFKHIQQSAIELKSRIEAAKNGGDYQETVKEESEIKSSTDELSLKDTEGEKLNPASYFDKPMSLRVCMFQLSESNNLERITNVLQNLCKYSKDSLYKLWDKYELDLKLIQIIQKYCNGDYGFDLEVSKQGSFQVSYIKAVTKTFSNDVLVENLANSDFFELYGQIIEEALIFAYDFTFKDEMPKECKIFEFLDLSLEVFRVMAHYKYVPFMPAIHEMLSKLDERIQKVSSGGESSR